MTDVGTTVGVLVFDDVEELDFVGPFEVFGMASRFGAECSTLLVSADGSPVRARQGLRVVPDSSIADAPPLGLLIVPGGLGARTHARADGRLLEFVLRQQGTVASVCTGALILAAAGLLDGLLATTHHTALHLLLNDYPRVDLELRARFILHERIATSAGVSSGIDLSLALVERIWGPNVAAALMKNLEWQPAPSVWGLRPATERDRDAIQDCLEAAFHPYQTEYTAAAYADTVPNREALDRRLATMSTVVAVSRQTVIGTLSLEVRSGGEGHLRGMAVLPEYHGRAVAETLLHAAESLLRASGCTRVTLDTTDPMQRAMAFYRKCGYVATGRHTDLFGMRLREYEKML